jgi:hypothetical protein
MTVGPSRYVKNVTEKAILLRARSSAQGLNFAEVKGETAEQIDPIVFCCSLMTGNEPRGQDLPRRKRAAKKLRAL